MSCATTFSTAVPPPGVHLGVLTLAVDSMKDTVKAFEEAGMRENVHIIVGGNPLTEDGCKYIGADAWAILPPDTVRICTEWARAV